MVVWATPYGRPFFFAPALNHRGRETIGANGRPGTEKRVFYGGLSCCHTECPRR
jgi:hypothetical protein